MAKLTSEQKAQFNDAKKWFGELEMRVFFSRELKMMIGIMPDGGETKNPLIYRMHVALCHPNDEFKKKLGLIQLLRAYDDSNFNLVRIHSDGMNGPEEVALAYMRMFTTGWEFDFQEMVMN